MRPSISLKRSPTGFLANAVIAPLAGRISEAHTGTRSILPLRLERVCYARGGQVLLRDLTFTLEAGPPTIILGPNGAGKSLLLRLCHGLLSPTSGRISWQCGEAEAACHQAMVFQRPVLLRRSAAQNIDYALRLRNIPRTERRARLQQALEITWLSPLANRYARVLSGGEQQRLALARAWAVQPEVLFLDEPTANLDPAATRAVEEIIWVFSTSGTKVVMTTHDLNQARRLAGEIVFLHHGCLLERAQAAQFFVCPESKEARAYIRGELLW